MLKRTIAFFLILSLISAHFTKVFVFAGFELNRNYIAENLCVNKDKPELKCHGKCFLMKKLAEAEKKQQADGRAQQKNLFQEIATINNSRFKFITPLIAEINTPFISNYQLIREFPIFQPPS
nr:hypothetical protein [uncultured Pedobacter sp.]